MGNFNSKQDINNVPENIPQEKVENVVINDDEIFTKILDISNSLLMEYNNQFLDENFCNKLALIYEKKLSNLSIKLLREINNNINSNDVNKELLLTLQYLPTENDKFFVDIFKDKLEENFWSKYIELSHTFLQSNEVNIKANNIEELIREKKIEVPRYINKPHVNNLLESYSTVDRSLKNSQSTLKVDTEINAKNNIKGGSQNVSNFNEKRVRLANNNNENNRGKIFLEKLGIANGEENEYNSSQRNKNNQRSEYNFTESKPNQRRRNNLNNEESEYNSTESKPNQRRRNNLNNGERGYNLTESKPNQRRRNNLNEESEYNLTEGKPNQRRRNNLNEEESLYNLTESKPNQRRRNNLNNEESGYTSTYQKPYQKPYEKPSYEKPYQKPYEKSYEKPYEKPYQKPYQQPYEKPYQQPSQKPSYEKSQNNTGNKSIQNQELSEKEINQTANESILTNLNVSQEKGTSNKVVNTFIKLYTVPRGYQNPEYFCENTDKCKLTKKQLCQSISENFIVRNNIIAAILTTIPKKVEEEFEDGNGKKQKRIKYVGGICYQKFLNLDDCKVCVPYDYKDLKNKDINKVLKKILEKADYLTEEECRQNYGYFFRLSERELIVFRNKLLKASKSETAQIEQKLKYNLLFIEFTKKLKEKYFSILNKLITILEKMQNVAILNNTTLNLISSEVKGLIDEMYNSCHYYYVYAILSLINVDLTEDVIEEDKLEHIITKALK